jgi:23S rRNA (uracil1939-C5)-methyltransferase
LQRPLIDTSQLLTVSIEKLALGGAGIARHENLVIFVPFSCPGDQLLVRLTLIKKNYAEGEIVEILKPGSSRVTPKCSVFGTCGGCNWQHISYQEQLLQKQEIVDGLLRKTLGKLPLDQNWSINKVTPSPSEWNYRNRITVKCKNSQVGFFERKSHEIVKIINCPIAELEVNKGLQQISQEPPPSSVTHFRIQVLENEQFDIKNIDEDIDPAAFSQVNRGQNINLQNFLIHFFRKNFSEISHDVNNSIEVLDLYGGNGNLVLPLFTEFSNLNIYSIELNKEASNEGQKKAKAIKSKSVIDFFNYPVETFLKRFSFHNNNNIVLIDPPRSGCSEYSIRALGALKPQILIYISCNPATLARDLQLFLNSTNKYSDSPYQIKTVQPFDMFPQTDHVETLVVLSRENMPFKQTKIG